MNKKFLICSLWCTALGLLGVMAISAQVASNPPYTLDQSVIANGGSTMSSGEFSIEGTTGQAAAGMQSNGPPYDLHSGFWNGTPQIVTAATVSLGGLVTTAGGKRIAHAQLQLTGGLLTTPLVTYTNGKGEYIFDNLDISHNSFYFVTINSKKYTFSEPSQGVNLRGDNLSVNFVSIQ